MSNTTQYGPCAARICGDYRCAALRHYIAIGRLLHGSHSLYFSRTSTNRCSMAAASARLAVPDVASVPFG